MYNDVHIFEKCGRIKLTEVMNFIDDLANVWTHPLRPPLVPSSPRPFQSTNYA